VKSSPKLLKEMMSHSGGRRSVPVIVDGSSVTIGYGGT
jgi:hypothetical protein